jgi:thiol-disulfide isomerase/thioredoxin
VSSRVAGWLTVDCGGRKDEQKRRFSNPMPAGRTPRPLSGTRSLSLCVHQRTAHPPTPTHTTHSQIESVTAEALEAALADRDRPLVIDFYATWCGPCLLLARELEAVAEELGEGVRILKLDVDANPDIASDVSFL